MDSALPHLDKLRVLLCQLGDTIRNSVIAARRSQTLEASAAVSHHTHADTIYAIDKVSESALVSWFESHWPADEPVEVVWEGVDETAPPCFPRGVPSEATKWKCLIDPIDGTRGIMYDKRSAWALAGLAPQSGESTSLSDIFIAAMTEIPTTKQWRADQLSVVEGQGIVAEAVNVLDGTRTPFTIQPSKATQFDHGFASFAKFFPEGRTLIAQIEEAIWDELVGIGEHSSPTIFDDQYISTGGQFYEVLMGHDRLIADIRPLVYARLDLDSSLVCHPYDACVWPILMEAGIVYEAPDGGFPDAPLDTTSPLAWILFANPQLAKLARPVIHRALETLLQ
ncbi:MAG TPA: hypothetical protein VIS74_04185 [Chthoniobacterales bacterium]